MSVIHPARVASLCILLLVVAGSARAAVFAKYDGVDGESKVIELSGHQFDIVAPEQEAALILPAVQAVRAGITADFARFACEGTVLPELELEFRTPGRRGRPGKTYLKITFKDLIVTSFSTSSSSSGIHELGHVLGASSPAAGSASGSTRQRASVTYGDVVMFEPESGRTFSRDCSGGRCTCTSSP